VKRALIVIALVELASAASCRLFGQGIPCERDDNCPGNATCGVDGFCGAPGQNNNNVVSTLKGRAQCQSSDDCGGDPCSTDHTCAVTTWLDAGAGTADVRVGKDSIAFVILSGNAFSQCLSSAVGVASRAQAPGGTFAKHDSECNASNLAGGDVFAWVVLASTGAATTTVRELSGATPSNVGDVSGQTIGGALSIAVSGDRVLWNDGDVVRATGTSTTLALVEKKDAVFGTVTGSALAADDREVWGVGKQLVVADADPTKWSAARTFTAPTNQPSQIVLGATRTFLRTPIENNQQTITSISRDDPSAAGVVVDTIDGDNVGLTDIAAAGDNLLAVTNSEIRLYPADGSQHVSIATVSAGFGVAFADGYAWWSDGNAVKRVKLTQ
jgi:hypothetical protein